MIRAVIFDPDNDTASRLEQALKSTGRVDVAAAFTNYPHFTYLERILEMHQPHMICSGTASLERCAGLAADAKLLLPEAHVIATGRAPEPDDLTCLLDSGVREFLGSPFERTSLQSCLDRVTLQYRHGDTGRHFGRLHRAFAGL
jgi:hypothetical protein